MVGVCMDGDWYGFDNCEQCYPYQESYDFIVLGGNEIDSGSQSNAIVGAIRFKGATSRTASKLTKKCGSLETQSNKFRRRSSNRRVLSRKNSSTKCHSSKSFTPSRLKTSRNVLSLKETKRHGESFFTSDDEEFPKNVRALSKKEKLQNSDGAESHAVTTELVPKKNVAENAFVSIENTAWLDLLEPPRSDWKFECDNETLFKSLKNMSSSNDTGDLDGLVVSYDASLMSHETGNNKESKKESIVEHIDSKSPPYDPLYECAIEFARTHGYGFVKFISEENETMDEERAKRLRRNREQKRRKNRRTFATGNNLSKQDSKRHPVHVRVPAFSSSLKNGSATCRGFCGGRPRDPGAFCHKSNLDATIDSMMKDMDEVQQLSKDIREALTADMWLEAGPECREQVRSCFRNEKQATAKSKNKNLSPKRKATPQHTAHHIDTRLSPKGAISRLKSPRRLSCPPSPRAENVWYETKDSTPLQSRKSLRKTRSASGRRFSRRISLREANHLLPEEVIYSHRPRPRDILFKPKREEVNNTGSGANRQREKQNDHKAVTTSDNRTPERDGQHNPWMEYRSPVREMCGMMDHGLLRVGPSVDDSYNGELLSEHPMAIKTSTKVQSSIRKNIKRDVSNAKKATNVNALLNETVGDCGPRIEKTNSCCFKNSGGAENENENKIRDGPAVDSWLPGVMSKQTNSHYRLCNSLSATIFRESHQNSTPFCNLGNNQNKRLPVSPVEVVHVADNKHKIPSDKSPKERCVEPQFEREEAEDIYVPKCVGFEDHGNTSTRVKKKNCLGITLLENEQSTTECHRENSKHTKADLMSQSTTRCVRIKPSNSTFNSQVPRVYMSSSGHFKARSSVRADSCPNLTCHTSKMHRFPHSESSFQLRKTPNPRSGGRSSLKSSPLKLIKVNQGSRKTIPNSAVGDYTITQVEDLEKASPDLNLTINSRYFPKTTDHNDADLWSALPADLQPNISPHLAKQKSPRRKCVNCNKNALSSKSPPRKKLDRDDFRYPVTIQAGMRKNNNNLNETLNTSDISRIHTANAEDKCLKSRSESSGLVALNFNNNAGSKKCSLDEKLSNVPIPGTSYLVTSQHLPKILNTCSVSSFTSASTDSVNNNALPTRSASPKKPHHAIFSSPSRRRKWGPVKESPKFQQSDHSPERFNSPPRNETLKLPALPFQHRHESPIKPCLDTDHGQTSSSGPKTRHKNKYSRYESISVGFGAGPPRDDDESNDNYLGWWEKKTPSRGTSTVSLPPAPTQPLTVAHRNSYRRDNDRQKRFNRSIASPGHTTRRDHPLNKSYVISSNKQKNSEAAGDHVLRLPSAVPKRSQQQATCRDDFSEHEHCKPRHKVPLLNLSMEKLELPACTVLPGDRASQYDLKPNPSLKSPEFSGNSSFNTTTWTSFNFSSDPKDKNKSNTNNNSLPHNLKSVWLTENSLGHRVLSSHSNPLPDLLSENASSLKTFLFPEITNPGAKAFKNMAKDERAHDAFENVSNNASHPSNNDIQNNQEIDSDSEPTSTQQLRELERELSSLVNEGNNPGTVGETQRDFLRCSGGECLQRQVMLDEHVSNGTANASAPQLSWPNINNASSMNLQNGREREHFRRRRLHRELTPLSILSTTRSQSITSGFENSEVNRENQPSQLGVTETPMDDSQTQKQSDPSGTPQCLNINPNTPLSLPSRGVSSPLWGNMLSQDPMTRKLWSCEDRERRQFQAYQDRLGDQSLAGQPRLRNGVPYCPTTENYWQTALNPSTPAPTIGFPIVSNTPSSIQTPSFNGNSGSHHQTTEEMVVEGHEMNNSLPADPTSHDGSHNFTSFADLFRQLDSLLMRSQNQVSQRLEALGESMNARLKQLQRFVERHIAQSHDIPDNSDDNRSPVRKFKHPSIHLKRKASKSRRLRNSFPLNMAKNKRNKEELYRASSNIATGKPNANSEGASTSSEWSVFPSIKFKEMGSGENHNFPQNAKAGTIQGTGPKQPTLRLYKNMPPKRFVVSKAVRAKHTLRRSSTTCSCNHKHTRSCRRRRGMDGTKCNICLMGRGRRASSRNSIERKKRFSMKKKSTKRNLPKPILKKPKVNYSSKSRNGSKRKRSSKLLRRKVRFGKVSYANFTVNQSLKNRRTARKCVSKNRKQSRSTSRRGRTNTKRNVRHCSRPTSSRRKRKPVSQSQNRRTTPRKQTRTYNFSNFQKRKLGGKKKVTVIRPRSKNQEHRPSKPNISKAKAVKGNSKRTSTSDLSPYRRYKVIGQVPSANTKNPTNTTFNASVATKNSRSTSRKSLYRKSRKSSRRRMQRIHSDKNNASHRPIGAGSKRCRIWRVTPLKAGANGLMTWLRGYKNTSNSNELSRCIQSRKQPKKKRRNDHNIHEKLIKKDGRFSSNQKLFTKRGRITRYSITSTGYRSLIRKLKHKYERMCSMRSMPHIYSKPVTTGTHLCSSSRECLVDQFRQVISHNPASRLKGLKSILSPLDSSAETVCHLPQHNSQEPPAPDRISKQDQIRAANVAWGVEGRLGMFQHPILAGNTVHDMRVSKWRQSRATVQANDSPPKLHTPRDDPGDLAVSVSPNDPLTTHSHSRHNSVIDNVVRDQGRCDESSYRLQQVDSIELTRRRLAKRSNDVSENACCCALNTDDLPDFSTTHDLNMCTLTHNCFGCPPSYTRFYLVPEYLNSEASSLDCHQPTPYSYNDMCAMFTTPSSASSHSVLQKSNASIFLVHDQESSRANCFDSNLPTKRVEKFSIVHDGDNFPQAERIDHSQFAEDTNTQDFGIRMRTQTLSNDVMGQEQYFFMPPARLSQMSLNSTKDNVNTIRDLSQLEKQPETHITCTNNENHLDSASNNDSRAFKTFEKTPVCPNKKCLSLSGSGKSLIALNDAKDQGKSFVCSSGNDLRRGSIGTFKLSKNNSNEEMTEIGFEALKSPCNNNQTVGLCKYNEKPPKLNSCEVLTVGEKDPPSKLLQVEDASPSEVGPCPQQTLGQSSNSCDNLQAGRTKSSTSKTHKDCCELENDESELLNDHSTISSILNNLNRDNGVEMIGTNELHTEPPRFQLPALSIIDLEEINIEHKNNDASCLPFESEKVEVKANESESFESCMSMDNDREEGGSHTPKSTKSVSVPKVNVAQESSNHCLEAAATEPFEKDGVPQHPYLEVKCPGISTTWMSVAHGGTHINLSSDCNTFRENGQTYDEHAVDFPELLPGDTKSAATDEEGPRPGAYFRNDFTRPSVTEDSTTPQGGNLEKSDSGDLRQIIDLGKPLPQSLNVCVREDKPATPKLSEKNTLATERNLESLNGNPSVHNSMSHFERDELIFPTENVTHAQSRLVFSAEPREDAEMSENNHHRLAFSVYRQSQAAECLNTNATHDSSASSLENNNNAAESQLVFNSPVCLNNSQKLMCTAADSNSSRLSKTCCGDCMKHNAKHLPPIHQHETSISSENPSLETHESCERTPSLSSPKTKSPLIITNFIACHDYQGQAETTEHASINNESCPHLIYPLKPTAFQQNAKVKFDCENGENVLSEISTVDNNIISFAQAAPLSSRLSGSTVSNIEDPSSDKLSDNPVLVNFTKAPLHPAHLDEECQNQHKSQTASLKFQIATSSDSNPCVSVTPSTSLHPNGSFSNIFKESTNFCFCENILKLGKRKRQQVCNLSDSMAPPRKIPRMDPGIKSPKEHRRRLIQRRLLWQQRREQRFQALRKEKKNKKCVGDTMENFSKTNLPGDQHWCSSLTKRLHNGHNIRFRYYSSSDADCESN